MLIGFTLKLVQILPFGMLICAPTSVESEYMFMIYNDFHMVQKS